MTDERPKTVAQAWARFAGPLAAEGMPANQIAAMRIAFYSGGLMVMNIGADQVSDGGDMTEADVALVTGIEAEFTAFLAECEAPRG